MSSPTPGDELVEEIDEHGRVLRVVTRREMRRAGLRHRCTYVGVADASGRLLVHRRAPTKDVYPSHWDIAAGGVCTAGEGWRESAARELAEELGVTAALEDLGEATWSGAGVAVVGRTFLARHDGPFTFADGEVVEGRFVTPAELDALMASEPFCPDSVAVALPRLLDRLRRPRTTS